MKRFTGIHKLFVFGLIVAALLAAPAAPLFAEEEKPTADVTAAVFSQYVWRGYELSRDSVVIQPSMTVGYKGFSVNLWGNLDTKPYSAAGTAYSSTWNETDLTLSYSKSLGLVTVGGGYIYYGLSPANRDAEDPDDSQELFASVALNTSLAPTLTLYKEIDHYRNWYFLLGISHTFELSPIVSLKLAGSAGYLLSTDADKYAKYDSSGVATADKFSGLHDGSIAASLQIKATDRITITPTLSYIFPLGSEAKDEMKARSLQGKESSFVVGGILASFSF